MTQFDGTYEIVSSDNYLEYLKSLGTPEDKAEKQASSTGKFSIQVKGDTIVASFGWPSPVTFTVNKEVEYPSPVGTTVKTTALVNGNVLTFKTTFSPTLNEERVLTFNGDSVALTVSNNKGVKASRQLKKV